MIAIGLEVLLMTLHAPAAGPLKVCPDNPRYFADRSGKAVYLTGSHTWNNLQDIGPADPPPAFDWNAYLDFLQRLHHNFIRLWRWELVTWDTSANSEQGVLTAAPHPWARTGPGMASDGKPKFDLNRFDPAYFDRLRTRVASARDRGIYVSIMLFEGWGLQFAQGGWQAHPFHPDNNINGIGTKLDPNGKGLEVHELADPAITAVQEAYVRKVVDTVNDLDNVLYEISNENHPPSTEWQYHMIRFIHDYEATKRRQHPVGMTFQYGGGSNDTLFKSPAEWVSPNPDGGYRDDPPASDGTKVVLNDTDHLWGIGGNQAWVWKSFLRGYNPLFMDPYDGVVLGNRFDPQWDPVRRSLGYTRTFAERMDLARAKPVPELASTAYCLADPGEAYLTYLPEGGAVRLDLSGAKGQLTVEWLDPSTGETTAAPRVAGGAAREFTAPFAGDAVLYVSRRGRQR